MEKLLFKPYDKEDMRMAMLKHEETFKQQVYELHRLYQIQKILMKNMKSQSSRRERVSVLDLERRPAENIRSEESDGSDEIIDESEIELTLGPTTYNNKNNNRRIRKTAEAPMNSDSGPSFSSSSTGSSQMKRTINSRGETTRRVELNGGCQLGNTTSLNGDVEEELRLKHPPWLFQVLSLNMT
ncbi:hypothetical protein L484_005918 [Morus notabilis]|uniref:Uncharacterized protein n=1 Tax=Morus notabilis TaxID=981085 RepID=W9QC87_9ROSA|nr:uncharacterized protein LOC21389368 [Morus notabilis]XP_024017736.1 uncharacterized protein LOC21389368 [Morus notabilis]EXB25094.1 hypothetical protein L484_005918 [Morus notabilis]